MTLHEKQMELVDAVNNAKTTNEHSVAYWQLMGWREGVRACGREPDLISCDLAQFERGHKDRPMCCGVFNDWSETPNVESSATRRPNE